MDSVDDVEDSVRSHHVLGNHLRVTQKDFAIALLETYKVSVKVCSLNPALDDGRADGQAKNVMLENNWKRPRSAL